MTFRQMTTTTTKTRVERQYDRSTLLALLFPQGFDHIDGGADGVKLTFPVPGGGDYSNMDLDVDAGTPLQVEFTMTNVTGEDQ